MSSVVYHSIYPKLLSVSDQFNAYNVSGQDVAVMYYTRNICAMCTEIKDEMNALLTTYAPYTYVKFYEISQNVSGNQLDPQFYDVNSFPTIKVFKDFEINEAPIFTINTTPYVSSVVDAINMVL
ncbi:hypothetical protein DLAC_00930 [Tieghemostelium lacteum]|uniref:Thioredoxin domain-containing protein n=1 Tax=Tieghemostelium lacteum TaxID=361077 RepID=A0A152A7C2_TIELA|nr:hypothetical protein DLAC_00930 [Tieghemostelium lacteum]|eukprot:KYR02130.1 hypothetical protein DLAC_00930 [Tieghemostelium lacteum]